MCVGALLVVAEARQLRDHSRRAGIHVEVQDGFLKLSAEHSDRKEDDTERGGVKY
jgi:hypothetical protein